MARSRPSRNGLSASVKPTVWQRLDWMARRLVPVVMTLILLLMSVAPTRLPGFVHIAPMIVLISIYYWGVTRPDCLGAGSAFLLGLVEDGLTGAPLGVGALTLLLTQAVVASQHKFFHGKPFLVSWWAFSLVAVGAATVKWLAICGFYGQIVNPTALAFSTIFTVAVYPLFAWIFSWVQALVFREV